MFFACVCSFLLFMLTILTWNTLWFSVDQMRRFLATRFWSTSTITRDGEWTGPNGALHVFAVKVIAHNGNSVSNQIRVVATIYIGNLYKAYVTGTRFHRNYLDYRPGPLRMLKRNVSSNALRFVGCKLSV